MSSIVNDAGIREPLHEAGLAFLEDSTPAISLQEILPQEAKVDAYAKERPGRDFI